MKPGAALLLFLAEEKFQRQKLNCQEQNPRVHALNVDSILIDNFARGVYDNMSSDSFTNLSVRLNTQKQD